MGRRWTHRVSEGNIKPPFPWDRRDNRVGMELTGYLPTSTVPLLWFFRFRVSLEITILCDSIKSIPSLTTSVLSSWTRRTNVPCLVTNFCSRGSVSWMDEVLSYFTWPNFLFTIKIHSVKTTKNEFVQIKFYRSHKL